MPYKKSYRKRYARKKKNYRKRKPKSFRKSTGYDGTVYAKLYGMLDV